MFFSFGEVRGGSKVKGAADSNFADYYPTYFFGKNQRRGVYGNMP